MSNDRPNPWTPRDAEQAHDPWAAPHTDQPQASPYPPIRENVPGPEAAADRTSVDLPPLSPPAPWAPPTAAGDSVSARGAVGPDAVAPPSADGAGAAPAWAPPASEAPQPWNWNPADAHDPTQIMPTPQSVDPSQPAQLAQSGQPAQLAQPAQPGQPAQPAQRQPAQVAPPSHPAPPAHPISAAYVTVPSLPGGESPGVYLPGAQAYLPASPGSGTVPPVKREGGIGLLFDFSFSDYATPGLVKIIYILTIIGAGLMWLLWVLSAFGAGAAFLGGRANPVPGILALMFGWIPAALTVAWTRFMLEFYLATIRTSTKVTEIAAQLADLERRSPRSP